MLTFEELILIGTLCIVILENKINVTFFSAGKLYCPTLLFLDFLLVKGVKQITKLQK